MTISPHPPAGRVVLISNKGADQAVPVDVVAGDITVGTSDKVYTIDSCDSAAGWSVLNDATTGNGALDALATDLNHVMGTASIEFNKVDGTDKIRAGIQKTITAGDLSDYHNGGGYIHASIYIGDLTDVAHVFVRLGTDSSNYNEWRIDSMVGGWNAFRFMLMAPTGSGNTGTGWNIAATTYVAIGVHFDAEDDALADIRVDHIVLNAGAQTTSDISVSNSDPKFNAIYESVHEEDAAHVTADKGVLSLTVRKDDAIGSALSDTDGDYQPLITNEHGILRTQGQQHYALDECNSVAGWTILDDATTGNGDADALATDLNHVFGTASIEFNKVNGTDHTEAGIQKTLTAGDLTAYHKGGGVITTSIYISDLTAVAYVFVRLGTDGDHYNEWRIDDDALTADAWNSLRFNMLTPNPTGNTGNGWNIAATTYVAVGVSFDAEDDELADIKVDHLAINTGLRTTADITAEITSEVSTPNINLHRIRNKLVNVGSGAVGTDGTQRVILATDDPAVTLLGTIDADTSKIPSLGTAIMTGAAPVTIATDDTITAAGNASLVNIEKCQMGNAAPTIDSPGIINAPINAGTGARTEIIATPGANKQIWVYGLLILVDTVDCTVTLESAANALSGAMPQADNGGFHSEPSGNFAMPLFKCNTNEAFNITMGTGVGDGIVSYAVVSV